MKELGIRDYFDVLITCDDTDKHKPDPTPLRMALEELSAKPEDAIMLGDTKFDIGCCNNAGVDSILVGWSHDIDENELKELGFRHVPGGDTGRRAEADLENAQKRI